MYQIIVIGGGPAGLTAAMYALRSGKSVLVFEDKAYGGQISKTGEVENYPGFEKISGTELSSRLRAQAESFGCHFRAERVVSVKDGKRKSVVTSLGEYECEAVIFAPGCTERKSGLENEEQYIGRGVSYCAHCDGNFFRGRSVAVVGGGSTAIQDALYLSNLCKRVYLIHRRDSFRAEPELVLRLRERENVELVTDSVLEEISGSPILSLVRIKNVKSGEARELEVNGLFMAIGQVPQTASFKDILPLDKHGYVLCDESCTVSEGIFVCGDCRQKEIRQLTTAVSDGTVAGIKASELCDRIASAN